MYKLYTVLWNLLFLQQAYGAIKWQSLNGNIWHATGTNPPSTISVILPNTQVPGNIHTDWFRHMGLKQDEDPYYRFNDEKLAWIALYDWNYHRTFKLENSIQRETWLICEGLDTVADIIVNGKLLGHTDNMFINPYKFNVSNLLQVNYNSIEIQFKSALKAANLSNTMQPYTIPPECPPDVQHGYCHINLLRKEQSSFSWDWGPAFATQGIWKPIYLLSFNDAFLSKAAASFEWESSTLKVDLQFYVSNVEPTSGLFSFYVNELNIQHHENVTFPSNHTTVTIQIKVDLNNVNFSKWWPNGYGAQKLYEMVASFKSHQNEDESMQKFKFGFRKVELVQEPITSSMGLSFYFKINDVPIFVKGSNWIPADAFQNRVKLERYKNLLQSAKDANMNTLRVWGGGIYESDEFYELADLLGIMLWQDFMFACGMYPADQHFLQNVSQEVESTLWRLKSHPSIIIWSGNNENEAALATDWYNTKPHFDRYKHDYMKLYNDTIKQLVKKHDTRPFLTSSPTNGVNSTSQGGVAKNPYDTHYGDVHYYNYNDDCLDWTKYPKTRFASEYGFQSWPSMETLEPVTLEEDRNYYSNFSNYRQHHANGNEQMLNQISMHFNMPKGNQNKTVEFDHIIYLTQMMQALCYKGQTEFYRRSRSEVGKGEGHTMGALYWQLNDIWQAPTWSSIEFGGKWKPLHYFARDFFSPVSIVAYNDDTQLVIYTVSDDLTPNEPVTLQIEMRQWRTFGVLHTWEQTLYVPALASKKQYTNSIGTLLHYGGCDYKELCYFTIRIKEMSKVPVVPFYPVSLKTIEGLKSVNITLDNIFLSRASSSSSNQTFELTLSSPATAAFVWIEAYGIPGRFSENAFLLYEPTKVVKFYSWQKTDEDLLKKSIRIKSLSDLYKPATESSTLEVVDENNEFVHTHMEAYWLEQDNIQLAWSMCGILFIFMVASMFVCVVLRLNKPRHSKHKQVVVVGGTPQRRKSILAAQQNLTPITNRKINEEINANESSSFVILTKNGYGHNAKNTEIRFHII